MAHPRFFGWTVVQATFVLALLGWGIGFYGPPVFLHAVVQRTGWPVSWVSAAVTLHFLAGTLVVANLPALYRRFGLPQITVAGSVLLAAGVGGWASADTYWHLLAAALFSGVGWVTLGAAAVNAIVSPWFVSKRPMALGMAYNGASMGGVLFSPLWVWAIHALGFVQAAWMIGLVSVSVIGGLCCFVFSRTPEGMGQVADGVHAVAADTANLALNGRTRTSTTTVSGSLWRDRCFLTLAAGMSLGLFAQIGLIAHLFSLLAPVLGEQIAGMAMGVATLCAILGRTLVGWLMPPSTDRRLVAGTGYAVQALGTLILLNAGTSTPLICVGIVLFGSGIGNATSLPPLIAQQEFTSTDARRVVPLIVATSQASYALAPLVLGLLRDIGTAPVYATVAVVQVLAIACFIRGKEQNLRVPLPLLQTPRPIMSNPSELKNPPPTEQEKNQARPATGEDAANQPADSTHDKDEANSEVQRTKTEGPRRMPQP